MEGRGGGSSWQAEARSGLIPLPSPACPHFAASQPRESGLSLALATMRVGEKAAVYVQDPK